MRTQWWRRFGELVLILTLREIKGRYKGSLLGPLWVVVYPLVLTAVITVVFSFFIRLQTENIPYSLFFLSGIITWGFFTKALGLGTRSFTSNRELIVETTLTAEAIPISYVLGTIPDFFINLTLLLGLAVLWGFSLSPVLLLIPVLVLLLAFFIIGISFFLASFNVLYKDVQNVLDAFLLIWFYSTPIIYPKEVIPPSFQWFVWLNPMAHFTSILRDIIFYHRSPTLSSFLVMVFFTISSYGIGYFFYRKLRPIFADII